MLPFDKYGAAGAGDPQDGTAAVDRPLGDHLPAFDAHRYSGKIGYDSADIAGQFVLRPDRHTQIRRDDYRNVTAAGGEEGIGHGLARQQAGDDAADGGGDAHAAGNVVEIHAAAGVFAAHAFGRADLHRSARVASGDDAMRLTHVDGTSAGRGNHRGAGVVNPNASRHGGGAHQPVYFLGGDIAAAGFKRGVAAHQGGGDLASGRGAFGIALDCAERDIAAGCAHDDVAFDAVRRDGSAAGFRFDRAIQVVEGDRTFSGGDGGFGHGARQLHLQIRHAIAALDNKVHGVAALPGETHAEALGQ